MKNDLRVIKTKKNLYEALITLMKEKTFEEIKVADICKKALINRSTFYTHYQDKYELLYELINNLKEELKKGIEFKEANLDSREYFFKLINLFLNHLEKYQDIYADILLKNRNSLIMDILLRVIHDDILEQITKDKFKVNVPKEIISKFYLGGLVYLIFEWLTNSNKYTKDDILSYLNILVPKLKNEAI